jgi:hypothetical protein
MMINTIAELNQNQINTVVGGAKSAVVPPEVVIDKEKYVDLSPGGVAWRVFQAFIVFGFIFSATCLCSRKLHAD